MTTRLGIAGAAAFTDTFVRANASPALAWDWMTRPDSTTSLGTANDGTHLWTAQNGTWGIIGNTAYVPGSDAVAIATVASGVSDGVIRVRVTAHGFGGNGGLVFRFTDTSNYWRYFWDISSGNVFLQKVVGGVASTAFSGGAFADGDWLIITLSGTSITGTRAVGASATIVSIGSTTDAFNQTATAHGLWSNSSSTWRLQDFLVLPAGANSSLGANWTARSGNWAIYNNTALSPADEFLAIATTSKGQANGTVSVVLASTAAIGNGGLVFRFTDTSNYWRLLADASSTNIVLQKVVAGVVTTAYSGSSFAVNDVLGVKLSGSSITVTKNGVALSTVTDAFNQTASIHGLWSNSYHTWQLGTFKLGTSSFMGLLSADRPGTVVGYADVPL